MNMKLKKQIALIIAMLLLPLAASKAAVEINGIYYNLNVDTKQAEVTRTPRLYSGNIVIPSTVLSNDGVTYDVTSIGNHAFDECGGLTSIIIPNSVTIIGEYAFWECKRLTSITIPNSVTDIGDGAFQNCYALTSVTIPNSVTSIGKGAFCYCTSLISATIGNSVTSIGDQVLYGCNKLTKVRSKIKAPFAINTKVFENIPADATLYVPKGTKAKYEATEGWKVFPNIVEMEPVVIEGDLNGDEEVDVTDVVELIDMVLAGIYDPTGDINDDGEVDVTDVVELIDMVLNGE